MINNKKPIPEDAVKPPSAEDVEFIEFKWMKMSDVKKTLDRKLKVRTQDIDIYIQSLSNVPKSNSQHGQNKRTQIKFLNK